MSIFLFRGLAVFFILIVATSIMMDMFKLEFGMVNFWNKHNVLFLVFITFFPRLTLLFSSVATGGFIWWLAFIFTPRILVAVLATIAYFHTNPVLVTISWLVAISGEVLEKWKLGSNQIVFRSYRMGATPQHYPDEGIYSKNVIKKDDEAIEAEFKKH